MATTIFQLGGGGGDCLFWRPSAPVCATFGAIQHSANTQQTQTKHNVFASSSDDDDDDSNNDGAQANQIGRQRQCVDASGPSAKLCAVQLHSKHPRVGPTLLAFPGIIEAWKSLPADDGDGGGRNKGVPLVEVLRGAAAAAAALMGCKQTDRQTDS